MKKIILFSFLVFSLSASAFWGNNNDRNNNGWNNWNPYNAWDPRYWMEEFEDVFNNNNALGNNYYRPDGYGYQPLNNFNNNSPMSYQKYPSLMNQRMPYNHNKRYRSYQNTNPAKVIKK